VELVTSELAFTTLIIIIIIIINGHGKFVVEEELEVGL
jgi:hypothetical protein